MSDNPDNKKTEEVRNAEVTELEEGDLQDVSGGVLNLQKLEVPAATEAEMPAGSCTSSISNCCGGQQLDEG